jgi:hypothetical protein
MNPNWSVFRKERVEIEQELCLYLGRLDEADFGTRAEAMIRRRWLIQEFRKLLRSGKRSEAENKFLCEIDELRRKAFDRIIRTRILRAKIHADAARLGLAQDSATVDETRIKAETLAEFQNALLEISAKPIPVW